MSSSAAIVELTSLSEQLDELSTRLIVDGYTSLASEDFVRLYQLADAQGNGAFQAAAHTLAVFLAGPQMLKPSELTHLFGDALENLRSLLDPSGPGPAQASQHPQTNLLAEDEDLILEFITESGEHLVNIEAQMLLLEKNAEEDDARETLNAVFRAFHTIKGLAGFLDFQIIREVAHEVETLLDLARNEKLKVDPAVVDIVLESGDFLQTEINAVEVTLQSGTQLVVGNHLELMARIRAVAATPGSQEVVSADAAVTAEPVKDAKPKAAKPAKKPVKSTKSEAGAKSVSSAKAATIPVEVSLNVVTLPLTSEVAPQPAPVVAPVPAPEKPSSAAAAPVAPSVAAKNRPALQMPVRCA